MIHLARHVFAVLVVGTFAAFFVAQRLKHAPSVVQAFRASPFFSPNSDGRFDRAVVSFLLKRAATVTARWDGRLPGGRAASPGTYLASVEVRDRAGNIGRSPVLGRGGVPVA